MASERTESVERALSILESFSIRTPRLTLAELARETGLPKSTILRLTTSLKLYGFIDRDSQGRFFIGAGIWRLGVVFQQGLPDGEVIRPALRALVAETGETASFFVRSGNDRLCLFRENNADLERYGVEEGMRLSLTSGASGVVLRRHSSPCTVPIRNIPATLTIDMDETRNPNIASISTPVFSRTGHFSGALTISGQNTRFDADARARITPLLEMAAQKLRSQIP